MMKTWPVNCTVIVLLSVLNCSLAFGEADDEEVDMAFLEFLADWEDDQGQWVDPMSFAGEQEDGLIEVSNDE